MTREQMVAELNKHFNGDIWTMEHIEAMTDEEVSELYFLEIKNKNK